MNNCVCIFFVFLFPLSLSLSLSLFQFNPPQATQVHASPPSPEANPTRAKDSQYPETIEHSQELECYHQKSERKLLSGGLATSLNCNDATMILPVQ